MTGLAARSTMRIGRPMFDMFCLSESTPMTLHTVASRSIGDTGRSSTVPPSALVLPTAWPPLVPPPARTALQALG